MSEPRFENVRFELRAGAAWIIVNRPDKLNALDRRTVEEIVIACGHAIDEKRAAAVVLTGAGEKAFVAGADIAQMAQLDPAGAHEFARFLQTSLDRLERSPKPLIAAVNGFALGGGCELAMACHVRIVSERARFGQPEVNLGLIPGAGGTQRLQRIVGRGRALGMILSGEIIDAAEAHRIGLANQVTPPEQLADAVDAYVKTLEQKSPIALARALEAVLSGGECALPEALRMEAALFALCFATEDMREGTRAFLERRPPRFAGR